MADWSRSISLYDGSVPEPAKLYGINKLRETLVVAESTRRSMKGNRSQDTKPEIALRQALWRAGLRGYRKNVRRLPGTPDVAYIGRKVAVFVHGCFWHRHEGCRYTTTPRTNEDFWQQKFQGNVARDRRHAEMLRALGWRVAIVWECALKHSVEETVQAVDEWLHGDEDVLVISQIID